MPLHSACGTLSVIREVNSIYGLTLKDHDHDPNHCPATIPRAEQLFPAFELSDANGFRNIVPTSLLYEPSFDFHFQEFNLREDIKQVNQEMQLQTRSWLA